PTSPLFPYTTLFRSRLARRMRLATTPTSGPSRPQKKENPRLEPGGDSSEHRATRPRTNRLGGQVTRCLGSPSTRALTRLDGDPRDRKSTRLNSSHSQ